MSAYLIRKVSGAFRYTRINAVMIYSTVNTSTPSVKKLPFTLISRQRKQRTYMITLMMEKKRVFYFKAFRIRLEKYSKDKDDEP